MTTDDSLLPADPTRGLTADAVTAEEADFDGLTYAYAMTTPIGAARLRQVVAQVRAVLGAGLGRNVALATLHGGLVRMERDGLPEVSDTVVRSSIAAALEDDCAAADVGAFSDEELNEVALLLSLRSLEGARTGFLSGLTGR